MVQSVSRQVDARIKRCLCKHNYSAFNDYHGKKIQFAAQVDRKGRVFPHMFGFESWISNKGGRSRGRFLLRYCGGWADYITEQRRHCAAYSKQVPPPPPSAYNVRSEEEEEGEDEDDEDDDGISSSSTTSRETNSTKEAMYPYEDDYSHPSSRSPTPPSPPSVGSDDTVSSGESYI